MLTPEKIARINELANKSKKEGLTEAEQKEQKQLRDEYLQSVRDSLKVNLLNVKVVDPKGRDVTPAKLKREQRNRNMH